MGLDFSHGNVHFSYSRFYSFRIEILKKICPSSLLLDKKGFQYWNVSLVQKLKDPLKFLINHSDCDGQISARRCKKISIRLKDISLVIDKDYQVYCIDLAKAMENAYKENKPLLFM